ncbi:MAG: hypothetical protein E3K37_14045 [Candidatus Kuenenia sp.]|nr:hypothetical protein [Candidatus Kuenenia hertensis]
MSRFKIIATRFFSIGCIIFFLLCGIYFSVPVFLERKVLPGILEKTGCEHSICDVRKFGFTGLDVTSLCLGNQECPSVFLDSIRLDYSLPSLIKKHIKRIIISGVEIRAEFKDGKLSIPGIDLGYLFGNPSNTDRKQQKTPQKIHISIGEIEIRNAVILLKSGDEDFYIPFRIKMHPVFKEKEEQPSGYKLHCWLDPQLADIFPGVKIKSQIHAFAEYDFTTGTFESQLNLTDMDIRYDDIQFRNSSKDVPLTITVTGTRNLLRLHFNRFCVRSPFPFELSMHHDAILAVNISKDTLNAEGSINMLFNKDLINNDSRFDAKLNQSVLLPFFLKGEKQGEMWCFSLNSPGTPHPLDFSRRTEMMSISPKEISIQGEGLDASGALQFAVNFSSVVYKGNNMYIVIPHVSLEGSGTLNKLDAPSINTFVQISNAEFASNDFHAKKIEAKIPLQWPFPSLGDEYINVRDAKDRYFVINAINYSGINIGTITATPYQKGKNLYIAGLLKSVFPGLNINFTNLIGLSDKNTLVLKGEFNSGEQEKAIQCKLPLVAEQLGDIFFEGIVTAKGKWDFNGGNITSTGMVGLGGANIIAPEIKMAMEGSELKLTLRDLLNFRSDPDQTLKFQRFTWGDIEVNAGDVAFQIESPSSFFLKKSSFSWCGGNVYTHGLRLKSGIEGFDIICYCDRLKLAAILRQFHLASAEGEGSVNGRLPISYENGKIKITDGFLYSTPGEGGIVRFDTETLIPGAAGIQQGIQTQIAHEALKNFQYDWAKLSLSSREENLHVHLQMEGRPVGLLPFTYSKESGLVKTEGTPRAHFQGILFNFNFTLPLDEMLHYGTGFSDLLKSQ